MGLLLKKSKSFEWNLLLLFFVLNDNELSSHMSQINEYINSSNLKKYYNKVSKMIVKLVINKGKNKDNTYPQLIRLHNSLLMSIFDTSENYLSNVEGRYDIRKVCRSSVK